MKPILQSMVISNFRGLRGKHSFQIGTDITVLGGGNGTGKTSVFDALQWAVLGTVKRLTGTRDFLLAGDVLKNRFSDDAESVTASALFDTDAGQLAMHRTEKEHHALLAGERITIEMAHTILGLNIENPYTSFMRGRMLTQEEISQFISASPRERYDQLKALLPIFQMSSETAFADRVEIVHKQLLAESQRLLNESTRVSHQLAELRKDEAVLAVREGASTALSDAEFIQEEASLVAEASTSMQIETSPQMDSNSLLATLTARVKQLQVQREELHTLKTGFNNAQRVRNQIAAASETLVQVDSAIERLVGESVEAQRKLSDVERDIVALSTEEERIRNQHSDYVKILSSIERFISKDECPVCEQAIDAEKLRSVIRSKVESKDLPYARLQQDITRQRSDVTTLRTSVVKLQDELGRLRSSRLQTAQSQETLIAQNRAFERSLESLSNLSETPITSTSDIDAIEFRLSDHLSRAQAFLHRLQELRSRKEASDRGSLLRSKQESIKESADAEKSLQDASRRINSLVGTLGYARTAIRDAQVSVVSRVLKQYQPFIEQLFGRLKPHPVFSQFLLDVDPAYKEGELYLKGSTPEGTSVHINTVFSMAQRNAVALCIFLALNLSLGPEKQFAFIDDPIQSMDDLNTLELVDLFRELRPFRQFVVSTHDRRLFNLMLEKMRPGTQAGEVKAYWFESWDRRGPTAREITPPPPSEALTLDQLSEILAQESAA